MVGCASSHGGGEKKDAQLVKRTYVPLLEKRQQPAFAEETLLFDEKEIPSIRSDATKENRPDDVVELRKRLFRETHHVNCCIYSEPDREIVVAWRGVDSGLPPKASSISSLADASAVAYCGKECQEKDWKAFHKRECKRLREGTATREDLNMCPTRLFNLRESTGENYAPILTLLEDRLVREEQVLRSFSLGQQQQPQSRGDIENQAFVWVSGIDCLTSSVSRSLKATWLKHAFDMPNSEKLWEIEDLYFVKLLGCGDSSAVFKAFPKRPLDSTLDFPAAVELELGDQGRRL